MIEKKDFIECLEEIIEDQECKYFMVAVEGVGEVAELIINHRQNFKSKYDYYREHYDNEMRLFKNPKIQITFIMGMESMADLVNLNDLVGSENA